MIWLFTQSSQLSDVIVWQCYVTKKCKESFHILWRKTYDVYFVAYLMQGLCWQTDIWPLSNLVEQVKNRLEFAWMRLSQKSTATKVKWESTSINTVRSWPANKMILKNRPNNQQCFLAIQISRCSLYWLYYHTVEMMSYTIFCQSNALNSFFSWM